VAKSSRAPRSHFWMLVVLAELPDFDVFFGWFGFHDLLSLHRSWTHSFLAAGVMGLLAWVLARRIWRWEGLSGFAAYMIASESHVFCDWMTSYGTPLFWPFSSANFSLDLVSNLSLGPLVILACGLLALKIWKDKSHWIVPSLWGALGVFLAFSIILHAQALAYAGPGPTAYALPDLVNPLKWRVIHEDRLDREYRIFGVEPLSKESVFLGAYPLPPDSPWIGASQSDVRVQRFLRNDRWPVAWIAPKDGGEAVEWGNLLFFWSGRLRGKLTVNLDAKGKVVSVYRGSREVRE